MIIDRFIKSLSALPGLGSRSARRIAIHLLTHKDEKMLPLIAMMKDVADRIEKCTVCGNLDASDPCHICADTGRDSTTLCVVANVSDLWAMERTRGFKGHYHVLGGLLSALDGIGPDKLSIDKLIRRVDDNNFEEVILALNATVDGQSTTHYISECLAHYPGKLTKLAHGMPIGGELDYLDEGTITTAMRARGVIT